jgi:hypothetical protein
MLNNLKEAIERLPSKGVQKQAKSSTPLNEIMGSFLKRANLVLPQKGLQTLISRIRQEYTPEQAQEFEKRLEKTNYRELFEQLFSTEVVTLTYMPEKYPHYTSGMCLGKGDLERAERKGVDLHTLAKPKLDITNELLSRILPDSFFLSKPERICEVGGAWGATIKHLKERFQPVEYQNYEPDVDYSRWVEENLGAKAMPVDGETLSGTIDQSMDMVIANNVFIFLPVLKIWSYMQEMKRVVRKNGIILFNAVVSTHIDEAMMNNYLNSYFPKRTLGILPGDLIFKCFTPECFELLDIVDNEYYIFRCKG